MTATTKTKKPLPKKRRMAVAIAKDVLKQLALPKPLIKPTRGTYCSNELPQSMPGSGNAQPYIDKLAKGCEVCALGAIFLSHIRLFDQVDLKDVIYQSEGRRYLKSVVIFPTLDKVFSWNEQDTIEFAFEGGGRPKECMKAIMQNIVRNRGVFKRDKLKHAIKGHTLCRECNEALVQRDDA